MERCVDIPVSKELREKIKKIKRELTYEQFLINLLDKTEGFPSAEHSKKVPKSKEASDVC